MVLSDMTQDNTQYWQYDTITATSMEINVMNHIIKVHRQAFAMLDDSIRQGMLKGEVSLYH
jgi:hypothetical protein